MKSTLLKYILLFVLCLFIFSPFYGQKRANFPEEPDKYIENITDFFNESKDVTFDDKREIKKLLESFSAFWITNKLNESQKIEVIKLSNSMMNKKMKAIPHYRDYLRTLLKFTNSKQTEENYSAWTQGLVAQTQKSTNKNFENYLDATENLLDSNFLYKSASTTWKSSTNLFSFEIENNIPIIRFKMPFNLICYSKNDSTIIYHTTGNYYPIEKQPVFIGTGGNVYWDKAGYSKDSVYAELSNYKIAIASSRYTSDSVTLYNKFYFSDPILGRIEDKVVIIKDLSNVKEKFREDLEEEKEERSLYPKFESYKKQFEIKGLFKNVDYVGGFGMQGRKFLGKGTKEEKAMLKFYRENKLQMTVTSSSF